MTTLTLFGAPGQFTGFCTTGHAGYAEEGSDIVCSAISVLTITCINAVEALAHVTPDVLADEGKGFLQLTLPEGLTKEQQHDASLLLDSMYLGLQDIASQYPKFLQLFIQDRRKRL